MKYSIKIFDKVYDELNTAALYYNDQRNGLGINLLDDWDNTLVTLIQNPLGYEKKHKQYRQIMLDRFPYLIIFKVMDDKIIITSLINAKRHPAKRYKK